MIAIAQGGTCLLRGAGEQAVVRIGVQAADVKLAPAKPHRHGVLQGRTKASLSIELCPDPLSGAAPCTLPLGFSFLSEHQPMLPYARQSFESPQHLSLISACDPESFCGSRHNARPASPGNPRLAPLQ